MEDQMKVVKAEGTSSRYGTYEFSEDELNAKGIHISKLLKEKASKEDSLKQVKAEAKQKIDRLTSLIERHCDDITSGQRSENMECEVLLVDNSMISEEETAGFTICYQSVEYDFIVHKEPFQYDKHRHMFKFTEKRYIDNAIKMIYHDGDCIMSIPLSAHELQVSMEDVSERKEEIDE